jgi:mono/diheme cytochrome c family protein
MNMKRTVKRVVFAVLGAAALLIAGVIGLQKLHDPGSGQSSVPVADAREQLKRGEYLARAGNCMACHTVRGGQQYAGGRNIATPFGNIYSSNITPDNETGIGKWTADDFWRAIHNGKSKDGSFLYPAFPYPNYTKVSRADSDALFAHLKRLAPVKQQNRPTDLRFPYNQRILLAFWRQLYFTPATYQADAKQSVEWNRGAYLVQGLGHCAACHTTRDALGGSVTQGDFAGGMIPMLGWYAASLTSDPATGIGEWEARDIADLLKTGVSRRATVFGPMAEVVSGSLQHLTDADIRSMATYLKTIPKTEEDRSTVHAIANYLKSIPGTEAAQSAKMAAVYAGAVLQKGAKLYEQHCVECHRADGKGLPPAYPPLAGNPSLMASSAINPIRIVLNGGYPPGTAGNPRPYGMPPFGFALSDDEIASVVSYIRTSWGNKGAHVSRVEVARSRGAPVD